MSEKKEPQMFNSSLFSSPSSGGSGGLSMGLDEPFSSPFSLAPALDSKRSSSDTGLQAPSGSPFSQSSVKGSPSTGNTPPHTHSPRRSSSPAVQPSTSGISLTGLSTVSLDSPPSTARPPISQPSSSQIASGPPQAAVSAPAMATYNDKEIDYRGGGRSKFGWNDPPSVNQTPNRPLPSRSVTNPGLNDTASQDNFSIQPHIEPQATSAVSSAQLTGNPHANTTMAPQPSQSQGPPPSQPSTTSNPYRIGGVASKKPAYGSSGIASFSSSSQPNVSTSGQPLPPTVNLQSFQAPADAQAPGSLYDSLPAPVTAPAFSAPTQQSSSVWTGQTALHYHWFYLRTGEKYWIPFSLTDSARLEDSFNVNCHDLTQEILVPTDGGRYDVNLHQRFRQAVYWEEPASEVRRCSWFYKGEGDRWYLPYEETTAVNLESEFQSASSQGQWNRRVDMPGGESVIMHSQSAIVHYPTQTQGSMIPDDTAHPRTVLRGFAEAEKVDIGEQTRIDHLVFVVHGIGAHCNLSFKSLVDCVDDFREVSQLMLKTHLFSGAAPRQGDGGGRIEFLPVHWHATLHRDESGVDNRLKPLTLPSISRLRDFTNSTLTDILFFTSPVYCQTIVDQVASEMNRMYEVFQLRNPGFQGGVSVVGHSLGACVLFDLLDHQHTGEPAPQPTDTTVSSEEPNLTQSSDTGQGGDEPDVPTPSLEDALKQLGLEALTEQFNKEEIDYEALLMCTQEDLKELNFPMGHRKKLSAFIAQQSELQRELDERRKREEKEKQQRERKQEQEAVSVTTQKATLQGVKIVRGLAGTGQPYIDYPQLHFKPKHLFAVGSPIGLFLSVRGVEELGPKFCLPTCPSVFNIFHPFDPVAYRLEPLVTDTAPPKPLLMPHHKGRKRFHLELYENIGQVSTNLKAYVVDGMRNMWQQLNDFARSHTSTGQEQLEVVDNDAPSQAQDSEPEVEEVDDLEDPIGCLNQGARIDYVLQEKPIEKLNEYLFALSSHLCYWRSEDTALFILKEVYGEVNPELIKS